MPWAGSDRRSTARIASLRSMSVARSSGVDLPDDLLSAIDESLAASRNRSSMLQDIEAGRQTEIAAFNGEAVRRAEALDIDAPVNRIMLALVQALEKKT